MTAHLDWSNRRHWQAGEAGRCIYCGDWTPLVDTGGRPAHKSCAEHRIDELLEQKRRGRGR